LGWLSRSISWSFLVARHPCVHPEQVGASTPLAVHRIIAHLNIAARPDNASTAFAPVNLASLCFKCRLLNPFNPFPMHITIQRLVLTDLPLCRFASSTMDTDLYIHAELHKNAGKSGHCTCPDCTRPALPHRTISAPTGEVNPSDRQAPPTLADLPPVPLPHPPIQQLLTRITLAKESSSSNPQRELGRYRAGWAYISSLEAYPLIHKLRRL
jgi:hypothetical protein